MIIRQSYLSLYQFCLPVETQLLSVMSLKVTSSFTALLFLPVILLAFPASAQSCTAITHEDIVSVLPDLVLVDASPIKVVDFNITCLALSNHPNRYRFVTVLVTLQTNMEGVDMDSLLLIDVGCSDENRWNVSVLGKHGAFTPLEDITHPPVRTRLDCYLCAGEGLLNTTANQSDPHTHCVGMTATNNCIIHTFTVCLLQCY